MQDRSRRISSSQTDVHPRLEELVRRHQNHPFLRPVSDHTRRAFDTLAGKMPGDGTPLILDSGCGTGESSRRLAQRFNDHLVIGVDRSADRLRRGAVTAAPANVLLLRADLVDFWRLAEGAGWQLDKHFMLYPNPYPKPGQVLRRWHAHPVFPIVLALGGLLEMRCNWSVYAREFAAALRLHGLEASVTTCKPAGDYLSAFEKKYALSEHELFRVVCSL